MTAFQESVWNTLTKIPKGKITTYGNLAKILNRPNAVRAVGTAVGKNPNAPEVPCHRVVNTGGRIGKYSGGEGTITKKQILEAEGIQFLEKNGTWYVKDFESVLWDGQ